MATCDWCLREAPVQTIEEELWRFWGIISKEVPLEASLRNICETCRSRYEEFSAYIERCKSNESITTMVLAPGRLKDEPPEERISKSDLDLTLDVPFRCPHCGKSFAQSKNLKSHLRIHTGERPFRCPHCDKSFTRSGTLKRHSYVHTNAKPFVCSHCDRAFSQSSNMKSHLRVHTGEKPFGCPHCGKFFAESSTLKKHLHIHTGERPFRCSRCGMTFSHRSAFNRHAQVHTDDVGVALIQR